MEQLFDTKEIIRKFRRDLSGQPHLQHAFRIDYLRKSLKEIIFESSKSEKFKHITAIAQSYLDQDDELGQKPTSF